MKATMGLFVMMLAVIAGVGAQAPATVSPGVAVGITDVEQRCPTFSWAAPPSGWGSEIQVYALAEGVAPGQETDGTAALLLAERLPVGTTSWTPSGDACLKVGGRFAWYVRAVEITAAGEVRGATAWSSARYFALPAPSVEEVGAALETLRRYLEAAAASANQQPESELEEGLDSLLALERTRAVPTAAAAIKGSSPDTVGEVYGVVGTSASSAGGGLAAANLAGGPDLVLDGQSQGQADTLLTQAGIDRPSASDETFAFSNSSPTGVLHLQVEGTVSGNGSGLTAVDAETLQGQGASSFAASSHGHDDRYFTENELTTADGGGEVHWDNLTDVPRQVTQSPARGTLQVFGTSTSYNGNPATGYGRRGMHEACRLEDPESHFCSIQEVENAFRTTGVTFLTHGAMWVDNVILGSLSDTYDGDWFAASDWYGGGSSSSDYPLNCGGWTQSTSAAYGFAINTGAISPSIAVCDSTHPIACCK